VDEGVSGGPTGWQLVRTGVHGFSPRLTGRARG